MSLPQQLRDGYLAFRSGRLANEQERYRALGEYGQAPESLVIGCCDSRVSPELIFDSGPGELFVIRNIANLVPPYSPDEHHHGVSSALEFAVAVLEVKHVVVLGHSRCGGIRAFADNTPTGDFIGQWMAMLAPVAAKVAAHAHRAGDDLTQLEQASILASIEHLLTFPFVRTRVERGTLVLHGAYYDVVSGELSVFDPAAGRFAAVTPPSASPG